MLIWTITDYGLNESTMRVSETCCLIKLTRAQENYGDLIFAEVGILDNGSQEKKRVMGTYENLSKSEGRVHNYNYKIKSTNAKPKAQIHKYEFNTQIQMGTDNRHMSLFQWARLISVKNTNTKCHKYKYKSSTRKCKIVMGTDTCHSSSGRGS